MSSSNKIFNVDEVKGKEHSTLETTAAEAQAEAPTAKIARQVEMNAEEEKTAAQQAAAVARKMGEEYTGEPATSATDKLQRDVSKTTNAALSEGKNDVDHVKAVGAGYVEQVKAFAQTAIETAQTYLPTSLANKFPNLSETTTAHAESRPFSNDIPVTSAPLESGPHIVNSPYPSTTTKTSTDVGGNERTPNIHI